MINDRGHAHSTDPVSRKYNPILALLCCVFRSAVLTETEIARVCHEVLKGIAYLHSHNRLHRDLKVGQVAPRVV